MTYAMTKEQALKDLEKHDVRAGQCWRHYKGGVYLVVAVGIDEPTLNPVVIYNSNDNIVWVRTLTEWLRNAKPGVPRFERISDCLNNTTSVHPRQGNLRGGRFL